MPASNEGIFVVLPLPARVLSPNCMIGSIGGRFMKASATRKFRRVTKEAVQAEHVETLPWRKAHVAATLFHNTKRRRDQDDALGSLKAAYDGIVDAGVVPDDDPEHMERSMPLLKHDKLWPRVELTITRLE